MSILYGLGLGPGDPELLTLKALNVLKRVPVVAYPALESGDSFARRIAAPHLPGGQVEIAIRTPMIPGPYPANDVYDRYGAEIAAHLDSGRDVAVLCQGDPFFYGSFMYVFQRFADKYAVQVVPGVSSLGACAAAAGRPLASRNQVLTIVPATLAEEDLAARLKGSDSVAIVKIGRHIEKVRRVLDSLGLTAQARYVERATLAEERVLPVDRVTEAPYFSMILVARES